MSHQFLTDRSLAQSTAITPTTLIHIVTTGDTTQNSAGSSYKAELQQLIPIFSGSAGTSGVNGSSGTSGNDGTSGVSGTSGIDGTSGSSGTSGVDGTSGIDGTSGSSGTSGIDGTYGTSGVDGTSGSSGSSGTSGTSGIDGTSGISFSGGSGNCITDLYVSNIHSCSPLNINPLDEGNVYFGSTSALTIDLTNNWVGIGTSVPSAMLDVIGTNETNYFRFDPDENGGRVTLSGDSGLPSFLVRIPGYLTNPDAATLLGMVTWDNSFTNLGKNGDSFLLSSIYSNGLNIISENGINSEDYIRFYAGTNASSANTPSVHIQGSGSTRGNIGIGITNPTAKLHINNTGLTDSFLVEDSTNPDLTPFVIDNAGNVGIGTTAYTSTVKLNVNGSVNLNNSYLLWSYDGSGTVNNDYIISNDNAHGGSGNVSGFYLFKHDSSLSSVSGTGVSTLDAGSIWLNRSGDTNYIAGNVGIGTTSPAQKLHVSGNTLISGGMSASDVTITNPYVPTGSTDPTGTAGTISWSGDTLYFKNNTGWVRITGQTSW